MVVRRRNFEFFFLGFKIVPFMASEHFFKVDRLVVQRAGGFLETGVRETGLKDTLIAGYVPPGHVLPIHNGWIDFSAPPMPALPGARR